MQMLNINVNIIIEQDDCLYFSLHKSLQTFHGMKESKTYSSLIKYMFSVGFLWVIV